MKTIRNAIKSPIKKAPLASGELSWEPTDESTAFSHVVCLWFEDVKWKPPANFEGILRNKIHELGGPQTYEMRCRVRRPGADMLGITVELIGPEDKCRAIGNLEGLTKMIVCERALAKVWVKEAYSDPLGELIDFINVKERSLEEAWQRISGGSRGVSNEEFKKKLWQMGYCGDAHFAFNALMDDKNGTISAKSWSVLEDAIIYAPAPRGSRGPSEELVKFEEALLKAYPDMDTAFLSFDTKGEGKLYSSQFISGARKMKFAGSAAAIFAELDARACGFLRPEEFARLQTPPPAPVKAGRKSTENVRKAGGPEVADPKAKGKAKAKPKAKDKDPLNSTLTEPESEPKSATSPGKPKGSAKARPKSAPPRR